MTTCFLFPDLTGWYCMKWRSEAAIALGSYAEHSVVVDILLRDA